MSKQISQFEQALINRDGDTKAEAAKHRQEAREQILSIIENGGGYDEVEDMMCCEYGLEMDYIFDLL